MKKSKEEKYLEKLARDTARAEKKAQLALQKEERKKLKAIQPTEEELVKKYAQRVINNQKYHGRVDTGKFQGLEYKSASKNIWMDTDFYSSVVFQTGDQKDHFLREVFKKFNVAVEQIEGIQILNGMKLAKALGITLPKAESRNYIPINLDLKEMCLDHESSDDI